MHSPHTTDFYKNRRTLVTGAAGFIGSSLARRLVELGADVVGVDDLSNGDWANLGAARDSTRCVDASILDRSALDESLRDREIIFHEAALASVPRSVEEPERYHEVNVTGTLRLLEAARACGVRRIVFASSSSVYGDQPELPKRESQTPDPISPYAQQKLTGEHMMRVWSRSYGLETISLRYFNVFGPNQRADSAYAAVVAAFAKALLHGTPPTIFGDGTATRDFTYIDNVVDANLRAGSVGWDRASADPSAPSFLSGAAMNIACGQQVSVRELAEVMSELTGVDQPPNYADPRPGDVLHSVADISRARERLGFEPTVGLRDGLRQTIDWYRAEKVAIDSR